MSKTPEEMLEIMQRTKAKPTISASEEYPNGLGTFDLLLKEQRRTNILLVQLKNIFLGLPLGPNHQQEASEV